MTRHTSAKIFANKSHRSSLAAGAGSAILASIFLTGCRVLLGIVSVESTVDSEFRPFLFVGKQWRKIEDALLSVISMRGGRFELTLAVRCNVSP
jgi:hypothetical protein